MSKTRLILSALLVVSPIALSTSGASASTATNLTCSGCVGSKDLGTNSVKSKHIRNGQVKLKDLANSAKPSGLAAAAIRNDLIENLPKDVTKVLRAATIKAPAPGAILATYSMSARSVASGGVIACAATTGNSINDTLWNLRLSTVANVMEPYNGMEVFPVAAAGTVKVNMLCRAGNQSAEYIHPVIALVYVPNAGQIVGGADPVSSSSSARGRR